MDRLTADAGGVLTLRTFDDAGVPTDAPTTPTVQVTDGADTVVASGSATRVSEGVYEFAVSGPQVSLPDVYTATWDAVSATFRTAVEVIGRWPCTIGEIRAANTELSDTTRYPADLLAQARNEAMEWVEDITEVAWSTRRARVTLDGTGRGRLLLPHMEVQQLLGVTVDGVAWDATACRPLRWGAVDAPYGQVFPPGVNNVTVDYLHGVAWCPVKVAGAIIELALGAVVEYGSRLPERATSVSTDVGTFRLTLPGRDGPTGIPRIDAVLALHTYHRPAVG